jgi:hypothetical protein
MAMVAPVTLGKIIYHVEDGYLRNPLDSWVISVAPAMFSLKRWVREVEKPLLAWLVHVGLVGSSIGRESWSSYPISIT